jgi:predicted DNA-binding protein
MARTNQLGESRFVNVRMPLSMIEELESIAKKAHKNRSTVVRELLVQALGDE